jgi:hypothetical protein
MSSWPWPSMVEEKGRVPNEPMLDERGRGQKKVWLSISLPQPADRASVTSGFTEVLNGWHLPLPGDRRARLLMAV